MYLCHHRLQHHRCGHSVVNIGNACSQLSHKGVVAVKLVKLTKNKGVGALKLVPKV
jgi:hypothetical protein